MDEEHTIAQWLAVPVPMVRVRIVGMLMAHRLVTVPMRVRFGHGPIMGMAVMVVMNMRMFVFEDFVGVLVLMSFGQM